MSGLNDEIMQTMTKSINLDGLHFAFRLLSSSSLNLGRCPSTKASFLLPMNEDEMNKWHLFYSYE
jgi:hypothetical protein